jgi:hypothetical protein
MFGEPMRSKRLLLFVLLAAAVAAALYLHFYLAPEPAPLSGAPGARPESSKSADGRSVAAAFRAHQSNVLLQTAGQVQRVLADDRQGTPHERFILRVDGSMTVLVVHNLSIAPRVPVAAGDWVVLRGEYVWNDLGGLIHWTHHDPAGRHPGGWIRCNGRLYQ